MAAVIGHAIIEVAPDVTRFSQRLTRDLRKISSTFKKVSVGVSVGSVSKAFREFTKLNLAVRAATAGFAVLGSKIIAAGILSMADAAVTLSGALLALPAAGVAAAAGFATLKIGLFGVDDAFKAFLKDDMTKFDEKLQKLSPNAQKVIGLLKEFKPALDDFRKSVQDALFAGLEVPLRNAAKELLPLLKQGFVGLADEFNLLGKRLVAFSTQAQTVSDVKLIFTNIKTAFHELVPAGTAVAQAIRDIVTVGSTFLPQIAAVIQTVTEKFALFIAKARESGALEDFIGRGLEAFGKLIGIVVDLGKAIGGVLKAAHDAGFGILDFLGGIAERIKNFVTSVQGQDAIGQFFKNVEIGINALLPVLGALGRLFNDHILPLITNFAIILSKPLATFIDAIGSAFENATPGLLAFAGGVGKFLDGIAPALPAIGKLAGAFGTVLGKVLDRIAPVLERVISAIADALTKALSDPDLVPAIVDLAKAFGDFLIALAPLIPDLVKLAIQILPIATAFFRILVPLIENLAPAFKILGIVLEPVIKLLEISLGLIEKLTSHGGILGFLSPAVGIIAAEIDNIKDRGNPSQYFDLWKNGFDQTGIAAETWVSKLGTLLTEKMPNIALGPAGNFIQGFFAKVQFYFGLSVETVDDDLNQMVRLIFGIGPNFGAAGSALGDSFTRGFRTGIGAVIGAAQDALGTVSGILNNTDFGAAGAAVTRSFASGMRSLIGAVIAASHDVAGAAGSALPRSPAKMGPLSGQGWTPFRGKKLTEGFAEGMLAGLNEVRDASLSLAKSSVTALTPQSTTLQGAAAPTTSTPTPTVVVRPGQSTTVTTGDTNVRVFIDGRELRGVVVQVVDERDRALRRNVQAGVGGAL